MPFRRTEAEELHATVVTARGAVREKQHCEAVLVESQRQLAALERRIVELEEAHQREAQEYARLSEDGAAALFHALFGQLEERRNEERWEMLAVAVRLDERRAERRLRTAEIAALEDRLATLAEAPQLWREALARNEAWLSAHDEEAARALSAIAEERGTRAAERRELREAGEAVEAAVEVLIRVRMILEGASAWGAMGIMAGAAGPSSPLYAQTMMANSMKHAQLEELRKALPEAQQRLDRVRSECADIGVTLDVSPAPAEASGWFVDEFLGGISKALDANDALGTSNAAVGKALMALKLLCGDLKKRRKHVDARQEALAGEWLRIVGG